MPEDTLRLTVDPGRSFDVLNQLGRATDRVGTGGERIGEGFLRGERAVTRATGRMARNILSVQSATDAAGIALEGLERIFKIGLVPGVAAAGAIAGFIIFNKKVEESEIAYETLAKELSRPLKAEVELSPEDISTRIDAVHKATDAADKSAKSWVASMGRVALDPRVLAQLGQLFLPSKIPGFALPSGGPKTTKEVQDEAIRGAERELQLGTALADAELKRANLKRSENDLSKEAYSIAKTELDVEEKRAKLINEFITKGGSVLDFYKRLLAAEINITTEVQKQSQARIQSRQGDILKQQQTEAQSATSFFEDLGSGKLRQRFAQEQQRKSDEAAGRSQAKILQDAQEKGILSKDPFTQFAVKEADRLAARQGKSVTDLANTDFSNLLELSKYDFSGLQPLSGLTLSIQ